MQMSRFNMTWLQAVLLAFVLILPAPALADTGAVPQRVTTQLEIVLRIAMACEMALENQEYRGSVNCSVVDSSNALVTFDATPIAAARAANDGVLISRGLYQVSLQPSSVVYVYY